MNFVETWKRRKQKRYQILYKRGPSTLALIFAGMAMALWAMFALLSSYPVGLYLYYTAVPKTTEILGKALQETSKQIAAEEVKAAAQPVVVEPTVVSEITRDPSLPDGHFLSIPRIGVETVIWEAPSDNYEQALRKGVWRTPEFADPTMSEQGRPMILAAHRFGYLEWQQSYRLKNSFYNLPKLKAEDEIEIVWNQHRYKYKIKMVKEATEIDDYGSDLILYTCKFLKSPIRIFVYADLVK
jgi:sortase (surface protein transpeptidase)